MEKMSYEQENLNLTNSNELINYKEEENEGRQNNGLKFKLPKGVNRYEAIVTKLEKLENSNRKLYRISSREKENLNKREELIQQLNNEVDQYKRENVTIKKEIENTTRLKNKTEENQKNIADYCNNLKKKFKNIVETIEVYENTISDLKHEKHETENIYAQKLTKAELDKKELASEMEMMVKKAEMQQNIIREYEIQIEIIKKEIEEQKAKFLEKNMLEKIKYDELEKKYGNLQKKIYTYQLNEEIKDSELNKAKININIHNKEKEQLEQKIYQIDSSNDILKSQITELTMRLTQAETKRQSPPGSTRRSYRRASSSMHDPVSNRPISSNFRPNSQRKR